MSIIIVYPTALEFWLEEKGFSSSYEKIFPFSAEISRHNVKKVLEKIRFTKPVHLAVSDNICRKRNQNLTLHRIPHGLPNNSFVRISDEVFVSSPEMCFLSAATDLRFEELVRLGCDLCGIYVLDSYAEYGQRSRSPITTQAEIRAYLNKVQKVNGLVTARKAVKYVLDRSNSPMESRLATIVNLPFHYGGFRTLPPSLNYNIVLSDEGANFLGKSTCCSDMVWPTVKVATEYDSTLAHLTAKQHHLDKKRQTALALSDYKVITITAEQLRNVKSIEETCLMIRKTLGMPTQTNRLNQYQEKRRETIMRLLFTK